MRDLLLSPHGALAAALLTTALAALESSLVPWAPFLLLYALALPALPLFLDTYAFGPFAEAFTARPLAAGGIAAAVLLWEVVVAGHWYERRLPEPRRRDPHWSPAAALDALLAAVAARTRWPEARVQAVYGVYFLLWAPVAEELFFWGWLYPVLAPAWGIAAAGILTALLFGVRHGVHFLYLPRPFPWPAALAFASTAGVSGLLNGFLFEITRSLWPLILLHLLSNVAASVQQASRKP